MTATRVKATITGAILLLLLTGCAADPPGFGSTDGITTDTEGQMSTPVPTVTVTADPVDSGDAEAWKTCAHMYWAAARDIGQAAAKENHAVQLLQQAEQAIIDGDISTATDNNNTAAGLISEAGELAAGQTDTLTGHSECAFN